MRLLAEGMMCLLFDYCTTLCMQYRAEYHYHAFDSSGVLLRVQQRQTFNVGNFPTASACEGSLRVLLFDSTR